MRALERAVLKKAKYLAGPSPSRPRPLSEKPAPRPETSVAAIVPPKTASLFGEKLLEAIQPEPK